MNNMNTIYEDDLLIKIDYKKIYSSLVKGIKWVVIMPLITVIISIIYVLFIAKPIYTSETKLLLINSSSSLSNLSSLAGQFGFSIPTQNDNVDYLSAETLPGMERPAPRITTWGCGKKRKSACAK